MTIACPDCGTPKKIPRLLWRDTTVCIRCQTELEKTNGRSRVASVTFDPRRPMCGVAGHAP